MKQSKPHKHRGGGGSADLGAKNPNRSNPSAKIFAIGQSELAEFVGCSVADLREARRERMEEGVHWRKKGRRIEYLAEGVQLLEDLSKQKLEVSEPEIVEVEMVKHFLNPRIMLCRKGKDLIRVRVHDSGKYVLGMKLKVRKTSSDLWVIEGRAPRWRGRW